MKFSKIDGMKVLSLDAHEVGEISGAEIDTKKWNVTHIHIELPVEAVKELGYKKPIFGNITICLSVVYVKAVGDVVSLNRTVKGLQKIPECR